MLIGIDGNEANVGNRVGVNQYTFEILWGLYKLQDTVKTEHNFVIYLRNEPADDFPPARAGWRYKVLLGGGFWIIRRLIPELYLGKPRPDVFFSPSHYAPPLAPMPRVVSIMDLGYLEFSGQFKKYDYWQLKLWTANSIRISKYIIAISNSTKKAILDKFSVPSSKVKVTPLAYDKKRYKRRILGKNNYVLFLSTLKPSKNVEGLIKSWGKIVTKYGRFTLLIAGKKGWHYETIFDLVRHEGLSESVKFIGFVDEKDKPKLIADAKMLVAPSFWEGFGLHVLEAMAVGTPVVVSDVGSLPEVVGKAGVLVDPNSTDSIAEGMGKVLELDERGYNRLVKKSLDQAGKFSWDKTARETLEVLESAIK